MNSLSYKISDQFVYGRQILYELHMANKILYT
jgi:hypothetical protein